MKTFPIAAIFAVMISLVLFWLMQTMISNNQHSLKKTDNLQMTEFIRLKRETKLQVKDRLKPDEPPPPEKRPPPPMMQKQHVQVSQITIPQMDMPDIDMPIQSERFAGSTMDGLQVGKGGISTDVIPLVRIPPRYPMRAERRRLEGWVKIEFTITEQGTVKDAIVIESQPSKIFDKAALDAIKRWKFKAKIIAGKAFEQRAVQVLQFKFSK